MKKVRNYPRVLINLMWNFILTFFFIKCILLILLKYMHNMYLDNFAQILYNTNQ